LKIAGLGLAATFANAKISWAGSKTRKIVLGNSRIYIRKGAVVGTQVDRVIRDIAWEKSRYDRHKDPFAIIVDRKDLVPYMEGRLSGELIEYAEANIIGLAPATARQKGGEYYAKDLSGNYALLVDASKTTYPTVKQPDSQTIEMVDTHGFNMLVEPAMRVGQTKKIDLIIACMDLPSKAQGALQLAMRGIDCFAPCDRFISDILGIKRRTGIKATILGTAPIRKYKDGAVIGAQEIGFLENEPIVVQTTQKPYPNQYCDTASRYFKRLRELYALDLDLAEVDAAMGETGQLVHRAKACQAKVIGARVYNQEDAKPLQAWLDQDRQNRLILFHSAPYEAGYELFFQYPQQTSFGDPDPIIIG
jgi:hypothetical protein